MILRESPNCRQENELCASGQLRLVLAAACRQETEAMLEAAEAIMLSETIQEKAAQKAIDSLVAAEMIEEAAIEEAKQVVLAALMVEKGDRGQ